MNESNVPNAEHVPTLDHSITHLIAARQHLQIAAKLTGAVEQYDQAHGHPLTPATDLRAALDDTAERISHITDIARGIVAHKNVHIFVCPPGAVR